MAAPKPEPPRSAEIWLSTDEVSDLVRKLAVVKSGVKLPVYGEVTWLWSPGVGPVARVEVRHVPKVTMLPIAKAKRR